MEDETKLPDQFRNDLDEFRRYYNVVSKHMLQLCLRAYELDQENHKAFWTYAMVTMKASKSTISLMIRAGRMYNENLELYRAQVPYTKVAELSPISEQIPRYMAEIGGVDELNRMSQKEIRKSVKTYVNEAKQTVGLLPKKTEPAEPEQLGFAETMNRDRICEILDVLIASWEADHKIRLDRVDIDNLKYIKKEVRKGV